MKAAGCTTLGSSRVGGRPGCSSFLEGEEVGRRRRVTVPRRGHRLGNGNRPRPPRHDHPPSMPHEHDGSPTAESGGTLGGHLRGSYEDLRAIARAHLKGRRPGDRANTTSLVHETWLRLSRYSETRVEGREHFLAVASRAMRHVLIDGARRRRVQVRSASSLEHFGGSESAERDALVLAIDEALERLSGLDARKSRVAELRIFGSLELVEIAEVVGVSLATVKRDWAMGKAWLHRELGPR